MESTPLLSPGRTPYKRAAYYIDIFCCLLCASFTCFSLYTTQFAEELHYTPVQINTIMIFGEIGLYTIVPFIGVLADSARLSVIAAISGVLYTAGYLGAYLTYITHGSYVFMCVSFVLIAMATSGCYIACVVNAARLQKKSALLAIALPTTAYGASTLLFSQAFDRIGFFQTANGLNVPLVFGMLAILTFLVSCLAGISPVLGGTDTPLAESPPTHPDARGDLAPDDYTPTAVHVSHMTRFIRDHQTWLLLLTFVLCTGPLEVYLNNLGLISSSAGATISSQISLYSTFSTISRLAMGAYLDLYGHSYRPTNVLLLSLVTLGVTHLALSVINLTSFSLSILTSLSGWTYGSFFTLYPVIITRVWGLDGFATYWGMFIGGPAIGTLIYGVFFSMWYQHTDNWGLVYGVSGPVLFICGAVVYHLQYQWKQ